MRIGPAGENLVRYACVVVETFRHFGRLGLGAVFGSKKLKALVISGRKALKVMDRAGYKRMYDEIFNQAMESDLMKKYHDLGTPMNVMPLNAAGSLPTMNLKLNSFDLAEEVSGEAMAENVLARRIACSGCPVACIHVANLREAHPSERYFYKTTFVSYDYEPIFALGSMLGIGKRNSLLSLIDEIESVGLDAISAGVCLAWATEAVERGMLSKDDTIMGLKWGDHEAYRKAARLIASQPNEFYEALAKGVKSASKLYGGEDFALEFGGNEMPGYNTGPAAYLGFLIGGRHSHLDTAGYSLDQTSHETLSPERATEELMREERWRMVLNSLVVCLFARRLYDPELISRALEPLGIPMPTEELERLGADIYKNRQRLKFSMGFDLEELRVPQRIFETETPRGVLSKSFFNRGIQRFLGALKEDGIVS